MMKNVLTLLAKSLLVPVELTAAISVADGRICKKILGSRASTNKAILINSNTKKIKLGN